MRAICAGSGWKKAIVPAKTRKEIEESREKRSHETIPFQGNIIRIRNGEQKMIICNH